MLHNSKILANNIKDFLKNLYRFYQLDNNDDNDLSYFM